MNVPLKQSLRASSSLCARHQTLNIHSAWPILSCSYSFHVPIPFIFLFLSYSYSFHIPIPFIFPDTCHCKSQISVDSTTLGNSSLFTLTDLKNIIQKVCLNCSAYEKINLRVINDSTDNQESAEITVTAKTPRVALRKIDRGKFVAFWDVPGFALVKKRETKYSGILVSSIYSCWPVVTVTLLLMVLSGIVIWILVSALKY